MRSERYELAATCMQSAFRGHRLRRGLKARERRIEVEFMTYMMDTAEFGALDLAGSRLRRQSKEKLTGPSCT